jgi:hypothetical protein
MMKSFGLGLMAAAALMAASSTQVAAQGGGWWESVAQSQNGGAGAVIRDAVLGRRPGQEVPQNDPRYENRVPYDPRYETGNARGRGNGRGGGPPFCRNGQGHPTKGWQWCVDKGWANDPYARNARVGSWRREGWNDVIFRNPAPRQGGSVPQRTIGDVLGSVVLGRLAQVGAASGLSGAMDGRWLRLPSGGAVLQLRMAGTPLAELADTNMDGRADAVYTYRLR